MERKENRMDASAKHKLAAGTVAALALLGGGGAIAATHLGGSPSEESKAVLNDAAKQLGVEPSALTRALKKALEDRIDAAVAAGRLTKAQGQELKQRIESEDFPLLGPPFLGFGHFGPAPFFHHLDAAADYLGLTEAQLRERLNDGQTLAQIAEDEGKSVDGLKQAIVDDAKARLDQLVEDGRLTQAQADEMLERLSSHIDDLVEHGIFSFRFRAPHARPPGDGWAW